MFQSRLYINDTGKFTKEEVQPYLQLTALALQMRKITVLML